MAKVSQVGVLIDLRKHGKLWEDFRDSLTAHLRAEGPRESLASVKERLREHGKLSG